MKLQREKKIEKFFVSGRSNRIESEKEINMKIRFLRVIFFVFFF